MNQLLPGFALMSFASPSISSAASTWSCASIAARAT
jgi:hypothetical protein